MYNNVTASPPDGCWRVLFYRGGRSRWGGWGLVVGLWAVKWSNFWDTQTQRERHKLLSIVHKYSNGHGCFVTQTQ